MKVEIVILNYNGEELLPQCLPSIVEAGREASHETSVTVLDNESVDESAHYVRTNFPSVQWVPAKENRVLCSYNDYLKTSDADIVILLNNDIKVDPAFVDPLIAPFHESSDVFMVTSKCLSFDGSQYEGGKARFRVKFGIFWASCKYAGYEETIDQPGYTMSAGYGAFDREKFLELNGYDDLYLPGRLEDCDISFRAWKKGLVCRYEPASVVYHDGGVAFHKAFGVNGTLKMNHRNSFLFFWKNISDPFLMVQHIVYLPFRLLFALLRGQFEFVLGFFEALPRFPETRRKRKEVLELKSRSDQEVFQLV